MMRRHIRLAARAQSAWAGQWVKGPYYSNRAYMRDPQTKRMRELIRQKIAHQMRIR